MASAANEASSVEYTHIAGDNALYLAVRQAGITTPHNSWALSISACRLKSPLHGNCIAIMCLDENITNYRAFIAGCRTNETPEQQVKDAGIVAKIKSKLAEEIGPSSVTNISVNVTNDVVTLDGTVHNPDEKSKAVAITRTVPNVAGVNDNLQTTSSN